MHWIEYWYWSNLICCNSYAADVWDDYMIMIRWRFWGGTQFYVLKTAMLLQINQSLQSLCFPTHFRIFHVDLLFSSLSFSLLSWKKACHLNPVGAGKFLALFNFRCSSLFLKKFVLIDILLYLQTVFSLFSIFIKNCLN